MSTSVHPPASSELDPQASAQDSLVTPRQTPHSDEHWDLIIRPTNGWLELHLADIWRYRDLIRMFVRRDFVSQYKQTILGPLWFFIQPLLTTITFTVIFSGVANLSTDGLPPLLFYLGGTTPWNYFSTCVMKTSSTFTANANLFGKVYFPRLVAPISIVISTLIQFGIQFALLLLALAWYTFTGSPAHPHLAAILLYSPLLIVLMGGLGLGFGIIVSSLTTKYRDLSFLVTFGIQLAMYATPVVFPLSAVPLKYKPLLEANPMTAITECFRYIYLGSGQFTMAGLAYSAVFTIVTLFLGIVIFNRVEKTFMDTV